MADREQRSGVKSQLSKLEEMARAMCGNEDCLGPDCSCWSIISRMAKHGLAVLREPNEAMIQNMADHIIAGWANEGMAIEIWQAGIDAAGKDD